MTLPTGRSRDPISVWHRLLRGYGPFLLLAALALGMAVFVPSRVQESAATSSDDGGVATPGEGGTAGTDGGTTGQDATGTGGEVVAPAEGGGGQSAPPAGTTACAGRTLQVPNDPYSPACVSFSGSNGGVTTRGVTAKEIHISMRRTQDASFNDALAGIVGAGIVDTPEDVDRTLQVLVDYFNQHFQFYGRKIVIDYYDGQGALGNELVGNGRDKAEVDATKVAEEIKPFGDLSALSEPYGDALSRRKIMNFGTPVLSREWYSARRPYAWSVLPDCSTLTEEATEFVLKRLGGPTADFAGGDQKGAPRKITIVAPENSWYQECVRAATGILRAAGTDWDIPPISYKIDLITMSNQAANLVPKLKSQGITTILCGCDPIFPIFVSGTANRERYFPEFVSGYEQDFIGQLWDPSFQRQSFGISPLGSNNSQAAQSTYGYAAFKSLSKDEPANSVDALYYQLYLLAIGLQGAGPHLTPETFERGMFDYPEHLGPAGLWGFGPHDYTPMDDYHEFYWDADGVSTYNGKTGTWKDPHPGKRYRHGADQLPAGPPSFSQSK
jgi:hypothetical protein